MIKSKQPWNFFIQIHEIPLFLLIFFIFDNFVFFWRWKTAKQILKKTPIEYRTDEDVAFILTGLKMKLDFVRNLPLIVAKKACFFSEIKKFRHGDEIVKQGEEVDALYIIVSGEVGVQERDINITFVNDFSCWSVWNREIVMKIGSRWTQNWKNGTSPKIMIFFIFCLYRCKKCDFLACPDLFLIKNHWKIMIFEFLWFRKT